MDIKEWADSLDKIRKAYFVVRGRIIDASEPAKKISFWENELNEAFYANRLGGRKAINLLIDGIRRYSDGNAATPSNFERVATDILLNHNFSVTYLYHFYLGMMLENVNQHYKLYIRYKDVIAEEILEFAHIGDNLNEGSRQLGLLEAELKKYTFVEGEGPFRRGMIRMDQDPISAEHHASCLAMIAKAESVSGLLEGNYHFLSEKKAEFDGIVKDNSDSFLTRYVLNHQKMIMLVIALASLGIAVATFYLNYSPK